MYNYVNLPEDQCKYYQVIPEGELLVGERIFIEISSKSNRSI